MECLGLGGTLQITSFQTPARGRDVTTESGCPSENSMLYPYICSKEDKIPQHSPEMHKKEKFGDVTLYQLRKMGSDEVFVPLHPLFFAPGPGTAHWR